SYYGRDYPLELPLETNQVSMTFQESIHFRLIPNDTTTRDVWRTLLNQPRGLGRIWLGENHRMFVVAFYHELHCVWVIQQALVNLASKNDEHVAHCLNYLRQSFLCDADDSLEEGDFMLRDFEMDRVADTVVCRDWEDVFSVMTESFSGVNEFLSNFSMM
ncbi:hypothetical protein BDQ17DRAFT_1249125, partial [Cyathus striatus]